MIKVVKVERGIEDRIHQSTMPTTSANSRTRFDVAPPYGIQALENQAPRFATVSFPELIFLPDSAEICLKTFRKRRQSGA